MSFRFVVRSVDSLPTFKKGQIMPAVKAARAIKADRNPFRRNPAKKIPPTPPQ